jgi:hypothetical protein
MILVAVGHSRMTDGILFKFKQNFAPLHAATALDECDGLWR